MQARYSRLELGLVSKDVHSEYISDALGHLANVDLTERRNKRIALFESKDSSSLAIRCNVNW